jgi:hypothetical protein
MGAKDWKGEDWVAQEETKDGVPSWVSCHCWPCLYLRLSLSLTLWTHMLCFVNPWERQLRYIVVLNNQQMDKENVVYIHNGVLFSHKEE